MNNKTLELEVLKPHHAEEVVKRRLRSWAFESRNGHGDYWPFDVDSVKSWVHEEGPTPRGFLKICADELDRWMESDQTQWIKFNGLDIGQEREPLQDLFRKLWQEELDTVRTDKNCSPENIAEDRLYRAIVEVLRWFKQRPNSETHGVRITELDDDAIPQGSGKEKRYGLRVGVEGDNGTQSNVLVAITKLENGTKFRGYFNAVEGLLKRDVDRLLLVHHKSVIKMGAKTEEDYDALHDKGLLNSFSLIDHNDAFCQLECFLRFYHKAVQKDLMVGDQSIDLEKMNSLVSELGLLENHTLLNLIFGGTEQTDAAVAVSPPTVNQSIESRPTDRSPGPPKPQHNSTQEPVASNGDETGQDPVEQWASTIQDEIVKQLRNWGLHVVPKGYFAGPRFARLLFQTEARTTVGQVQNKAEDLKIRLDGVSSTPQIASQANGLSIDLELPERYRRVVRLGDMLNDAPANETAIPWFPVGQDVSGNNYWGDLSNSNYAHFLIAGTTGSGKSEFLRAMIAGMASLLPPEKLQFVLIDPKRLTFNFPGESPYFKHPVVYTAEEALPLIRECFDETEQRYEMLARRRVQDLSDLQQMGNDAPPRIVLICDEFPDLVADGDLKKDLEQPLKRIGAKARAAGVHLILAAQRPDAQVVTVQLRSNLPGRICLRVASKRDSEIVMECRDAANLLGYGDLLWKRPTEMVRLQGPLVSDEELFAALRIKRQ